MLPKRRKISVILLLVLFLVSMVGDIQATKAQGVDKPILLAFNDVSTGDPNAIYIKYVVSRGLMTGFPDGNYHPNEALTRAQAAAVLARTAGLNMQGGGTSCFKDVPASHWASGSIIAASQGGYIKGMSGDIFQPEAKLTRAQGVSLFMRLSKQGDSGVALPVLSDLNSGHWSARAVAMALDAGMVSLASDKKSFNPNGEFTRGDLSRLLALLLTQDPGLSRNKLAATLVVKQGTVKLQTAGQGEEKAVSGSTGMSIGDSVTTGSDGEAELNLPDGSGLLLKPNTVLTLKDIQGRNYIKKDGNPGIGVDKLELVLDQGRIFGALASRHNIKSQLGELKDRSRSLLASLADHFSLAVSTPWYKTAETKRVKVQVDMPWGVCGIRGSFWSNLVDKNQNSTSLLNGEAEVTASGKTQSLTPGQATIISGANTAPSQAAAFNPTEQSAWDAEKSWVEQRNADIDNNLALIPSVPSAIQVESSPSVFKGGTLRATIGEAEWSNGSQIPKEDGEFPDIIILSGGAGPEYAELDVSKLLYKDDKGNVFRFTGQYRISEGEPAEGEYYYQKYSSGTTYIEIRLTKEDTQAIRTNLSKPDGNPITGTLDADEGWMYDPKTGDTAPADTGHQLPVRYYENIISN